MEENFTDKEIELIDKYALILFEHSLRSDLPQRPAYERAKEMILERREALKITTKDDKLNFILNQHIDYLDINRRCFNCIRSIIDSHVSFTLNRRDVSNFLYIGYLCLLTEKDIIRARNFGRGSLHKLKHALSEHNLHLGMDLREFGFTLNKTK